jgi:hypothetical protein
MSPENEIDLELEAVAAALGGLDATRIARVLRNTIDQLYDGQRTGRYRWDQLYKTEKTHCGTLVEINLQREFRFEDGLVLDYRIAGVEVDCKYSQTLGGWMIPPEARNQICMLGWAEDTANPRWSLGLVRTSPERLNTGGNRDAKATLNAAGRAAIRWIWNGVPLPPNVLLQLDPAVVQDLMAMNSGVKRLNQLFRCAQGRIVGRAVVATVAQQDDYMKRVRANGGSRSWLKPEGIIILGQYGSHVAIAKALGITTPKQGDSISIRVVPTERRGRGVAEIDGGLWRLAGPDDPVVSAPELPKI